MTVTSVSGDRRIVLSLDAGGTSFRFAAIRGGMAIAELPPVPSHGDDLDRCLQALREGFTGIRRLCPEAPVALSFGFPGPADYPAGIIGDLPNLPAFRGGVPLGPMLADHFGLPVFINNDGGLFAYGEAGGGFLPWLNGRLAEAGNPRRYATLLGVTLGTGFGGGIVVRDELLIGDNANAGCVYLLRHQADLAAHAEAGISIRAVQRAYAESTGGPLDPALDPRAIAGIARGERPGDQAAARAAYARLGGVLGDALAQAVTVLDSAVVIGGGIAGAADLFLPAALAALNATTVSEGQVVRRLNARACPVDDPAQLRTLLDGGARELAVPGSTRTVRYEATAHTPVGLSRLGTSAAIAAGAYRFALRHLDPPG